MILIQAEVTYDWPLNEAEEARIAEAIRKVLQPTIAQAACSVTFDSGMTGVRTQFLNINTSIKVNA